MSLHLKSYTKALKRYDADLYAARTKDGVCAVFRKVKRFEPVVVDQEFRLLLLRECKQLVFALTDNWTLTGTPRDWGIDDVIGRIQQIDTLANERMLDELDAENERIDQQKRRHLRSEMEAFWSDNRRAFAKATDGILTHSLSKDEPKKRLKDRSIKNGNH